MKIFNRLRFKTLALQAFAIAALGVLTLLGSYNPVLAQTTDAGSSNVLETLVVTAGRQEEALKTIPQPITVVTEEQLQEKHASDLGDVMRQQGFQFNALGANTGLTRVAIRGFATSTSPNQTGDIIVIMDGRQIGNNNIGMVPIVNIERVEILRGPGAMQYGSGAVGGVINLITKRGDEKPTVHLEQTVASGNYTKSIVGFSGKYKFIDFSLGASMAHAGDYTIGKGSLHGKGAANNIQGSKVYANTGLHEQLAILTNLGFNFYENHRLGVIYSGYLSGQGRPGDLRNTGSNSPLAYGQRKNDSIDVQYTGETADQNLSWMVRYYNGTTRYTTASIWYVQPKYMYYDYGTDFSGYQGQVNWDYSVIHLTGGFESYENIYFQVNTPPYQSSFTNTAFYLLGRAGLINETLWLSFGGRYDKFTSEGQADPQKENRFTPSLGVAYLPLDWLKLRVNYGESFKMPTPDRLAGNSTSSGGTTYIGNPNLKPQTAKSWDFGLDVYYEAFTAGITYFTTDYKDMIQTRTIQPAPNRIDTYENLTGITKYEGLEFNFDWEMGDTFNWEFDLRPYIAFTRLFKRHEPNGNELETVADMSMAYGITFKHPDIGLIASLDANYYGKQMPNDASVQWGGIRFGGDNVLDFHISKDLLSWDAYGTVKVKVDVLNVTDKLYQVSAGYPQPGRTFSFSLVYDY